MCIEVAFRAASKRTHDVVTPRLMPSYLYELPLALNCDTKWLRCSDRPSAKGYETATSEYCCLPKLRFRDSVGFPPDTPRNPPGDLKNNLSGAVPAVYGTNFHAHILSETPSAQKGQRACPWMERSEALLEVMKPSMVSAMVGVAAVGHGYDGGVS